jgi:diacylglycerol kinase family enzyme
VSTAIIINPISGGASPRQARARAQIALAVVDAHGDPVEVLMTEGVGHARELAKSAVRRGARLVLAWGGDGTINEVASALAFDEVPLGIIPAGSGNGLARELGVHPRAERAIADALQAVPRPMDLGEFDGRLFANIAGSAFDAHVAAQVRLRDAPRLGRLLPGSPPARSPATCRGNYDHDRRRPDRGSRHSRDDRQLRAVRQQSRGSRRARVDDGSWIWW